MHCRNNDYDIRRSADGDIQKGNGDSPIGIPVWLMFHVQEYFARGCHRYIKVEIWKYELLFIRTNRLLNVIVFYFKYFFQALYYRYKDWKGSINWCRNPGTEELKMKYKSYSFLSRIKPHQRWLRMPGMQPNWKMSGLGIEITVKRTSKWHQHIPSRSHGDWHWYYSYFSAVINRPIWETDFLRGRGGTGGEGWSAAN